MQSVFKADQLGLLIRWLHKYELVKIMKIKMHTGGPGMFWGDPEYERTLQWGEGGKEGEEGGRSELANVSRRSLDGSGFR